MPRYVAMEWPDARVVEINLDDEVAIRTDELSVTTLRVGCVDDSTVPGSNAFREHIEIMAFKMVSK